jgi:hypothetical protein
LHTNTIIPDLKNPQAFDRYSYVSGNPINRTDPSGHMECFEEDGLCIRWTKDGSYRVVRGGQEFANYVEVAIANYVLSGGKETNWLATVEPLVYDCNTCLQRTINYVAAQLGYGKFDPLMDLLFHPDVFISIAASLSYTAGGFEWRFGSFKSTQKWANQMLKRGWTPEEISNTIENGQQFPAPNNVNPGNTATRYVDPVTGRSVVVDDVTHEVLHIGGDNYGY